MEKPVSKRRRHERSITPEKTKAKRKATLFVVEKTKTAVAKTYRERSETPELKPKKKNVESNHKPKKPQEPEKTKNSQKARRKRTPEREPAKAVDQIKVSLPITLMEFCDTALKLMQSVNSLLEKNTQTCVDKLSELDKRLVEMDQNHYKNWEIVSETLEVISKHIISKSNPDLKENDDNDIGRHVESPSTTVNDDILQKAEQFSEQNKAKIAEEKAEQERNERARTLEANSISKNQQTTRISLNLSSQGQQIIHNQQILEKQQIAQLQSQMWSQDQRESELMRQNEQQVRQQLANFYQNQQNARIEQHVAQVEQHIQRQREEITRTQELQQQQLISQHERLVSSHNEQLAKQKAQMANEPISNIERMIVPDYENSTPSTSKEVPEQRVLRPRPTAQVVLQDPFVQPKQKAPRKLSAKQIRERRASVQCERPPPSPSPFYPHLPMRVPQAAFPQTNARLVEETFQQQLQQTQAYAALKNQEIQQQQQPAKAAKVRERRKSCMPSMSYLDQNMCHEMLRRRLTNAQAQNIHEQPNFYPQSLRYFATTPQPGTSSGYAHYAAQFPEKETPSVGIDLSVNVEKTAQNLSQDSVDWMRGRSAPNSKY